MASSGVSPVRQGQDKRERVLETFDRFLSDGLALKNWFAAREASGDLKTFDLVETFNRPDRSQGFFGEVPLNDRVLPVMGVIDEVFYDQPKAPVSSKEESALWMRNQVREFVLRYFLRISDFRRPRGAVESNGGSWAEYLGPFNLRPGSEVERDGMGFSQVFLKRVGAAEIETVPTEQGLQVVDLREIGSTYEWAILRLQIYQFNVSVRPMGSASPHLQVPLKEESFLIITPDFIRNEEAPEPGVLGEYGFGYAFIRNPRRGPFAYGPGEFEAAFQTINFRVMESGETRVRMIFTSDQPQKVLNLNLDPVEWSFAMADFMSLGQASRILAPFKSVLEQMPFRDFNIDPTVSTLNLMNTLTAGQAAHQFSLSKEELYRGFLRRHSMQHYQTVLASLHTFRQIPDWLDEDSLPDWVVRGESS